MNFAVTLLMLVVAVVNSDEEGNFLAASNEGQGDDIMASDDGEYLSVTRNLMPSEIDLPTRLTKSSLNVGSICATCRLLFSAQSRLAAIAGQVRTQDIRFSRAGVRVTAVRANPVFGSVSGNPRIVAGGINSNTATVMLTSGVGQGFHYRVEFWGV